MLHIVLAVCALMVAAQAQQQAYRTLSYPVMPVYGKAVAAGRVLGYGGRLGYGNGLGLGYGYGYGYGNLIHGNRHIIDMRSYVHPYGQGTYSKGTYNKGTYAKGTYNHGTYNQGSYGQRRYLPLQVLNPAAGYRQMSIGNVGNYGSYRVPQIVKRKAIVPNVGVRQTRHLLSGPNCSFDYFPFQPVVHNRFIKGRGGYQQGVLSGYGAKVTYKQPATGGFGKSGVAVGQFNGRKFG